MRRGRQDAGGGRGLAGFLAVFEARALAVQLQDVAVVGQSIEQRAGQPFGPVLQVRVADGSLLRLIGKLLHVGVLDGEAYITPDRGTAQGSGLSPLLGNVYLHYALDVWFDQVVRPRLRGRATLVRYADDFVIGFERRDDAERVMDVLPKRLGRYGLTLHADKTRVLPFGRPPRRQQGGKGPASFDFLGFTLHWRRARSGRWGMWCKTRSSRFRELQRGGVQPARDRRIPHDVLRLPHAGRRHWRDGGVHAPATQPPASPPIRSRADPRHRMSAPAATLVAAQPQLALKLTRRDARCVRRDEVGRPNPQRQGHPRAMQNRAGGHRCLMPAGLALEHCAGGQLVRFGMTAPGATEPVRPPRRCQVPPAGILGREPRVERRQCSRKRRSHPTSPGSNTI